MLDFIGENLILSLIAVGVGITLLVVSGNFFVNASAALADAFHIPHIIIGATVVAAATSLPEAIVCLLAHVWGDAPDITMGNVIGSNICNIGLVVGIAALLMPIIISSRTAIMQCVYMMCASLIVAVAAFTGYIPQWLGILLLILFVVYLVHSVIIVRAQPADASSVKVTRVPLYLTLIIIALCATFMVLGSHILITGVKGTARFLNIPELVISLTVVAFGTSLPEFATSLVAIIKKQSDISLGNIIGSNFLNITFAMGLPAAIKTIPVSSPVAFIDIPFMLLLSILLVIFIFTGKKLVRKEGFILLAVYIIFIIVLAFRLSPA